MKTIEDHPRLGIKPNWRTTEDQQYFSQWENRLVTIKHAGKCVVCGRNVYQPTDETGRPYDPDPRGIFQQEHAAAHLVASEYSMSGLDIPLCFECSNTRNKYERGLAIAKDIWNEKEGA